jgi:hypothetical protein
VLKYNTLLIANVAKKVNSCHVSKCCVFCSACNITIMSSNILFWPTLRIYKLFFILQGVICNLGQLQGLINCFLYHMK